MQFNFNINLNEYQEKNINFNINFCNSSEEIKTNNDFENYFLDKLNRKINLEKQEKNKLNFLEYKLLSQKMEDVFLNLGFLKDAENIGNCSTFLEFLFNETKNNLSLKRINSCKHRLCPVCTWRRSLKIYSFMRKCYDNICIQDKKARFLFLTLTTKNCNLEDLDKEIDLILKSFTKFRKRKEFKIVRGWARSLELTIDREKIITKELYNKKKKYYDRRGIYIGDLNPNYLKVNVHIHSILYVNYNDYFRTEGNYLKSEEISKIWQKCLNVDYLPIVDIRNFKSKKDVEKGHEFAEVSKYTVKFYDLVSDKKTKEEFEIDKKIIYCVNLSLKNRRLVDFSGYFRKSKNEFKTDFNRFEEISKIEENDIIHILKYYFNRQENKYKVLN